MASELGGGIRKQGAPCDPEVGLGQVQGALCNLVESCGRTPWWRTVALTSTQVLRSRTPRDHGQTLLIVTTLLSAGNPPPPQPCHCYLQRAFPTPTHFQAASLLPLLSTRQPKFISGF